MRRRRLIGPGFPYLVTPVAGGGGGSTLKTGLISFWELEDTSWTDSVTATGNNLTGVSSPTVTTGKVGNGFNMTANGPYLTHTDNASIRPFSTDWTSVGWVKQSVGGNVCTILSCGSANNYIQILITAGGQVGMLVAAVVSLTSVILSTALTDNTWYFVVGRYTLSSKLLQLCVNDGAVSTATGTTDIANEAATLFIGDTTADAVVDQIGFWKRVLTASEITQLYNGGAGLAYSAM
jgi:Concanavalin A-like lectin/glucanases superfamily